MMGLPPLSVIRESSSNVSLFGALALPKNSTQNAGSKENEANEADCPYEAPCAEAGMVTSTAVELLDDGKQMAVRATRKARKLERHARLSAAANFMWMMVSSVAFEGNRGD